ncbi:phage protease [Variovorax sp.]|uniref:phage protease n=1 Tax=Variovorax sp. TaxID=1871043 RepID=UPI003BAD5B60
MNIFIAAASAKLQSGAALRIIPAGYFRAYDGRPTEVGSWHLGDAGARALIAGLSTRQAPYVIDYEHQTLNKEKNGQPAPASGWFDGVDWREGDGLYLKGVKWTAKASSMIDTKEYRYLSPVFHYTSEGEVVGLHSVALTNDPALVGLSDLAAASAHVQHDMAAASARILSLTAEELRISAATGLTPEEFTTAKASASVPPTGGAAHGLSADEVRIALATGLTVDQFAKAKAAVRA